MTKSATPSVPIAINGQRSERNNSDGLNGSDDMSFLGSPPLLGISFIDDSHHEEYTTLNGSHNTNFDSMMYAAASSSQNNSQPPTQSTTPNQSTPTKALLTLDKNIELVPGEEKTKVTGEETCRVDGGTIMLTNYRVLFLSDNAPQTVSVFTLMELELTDFRDPYQVVISMKGGRVQRFNFTCNEDAVAWHRQLTKIVSRLNRGHSVVATGIAATASGSNGVDSSTNPETNDITDVFTWQFSEAMQDRSTNWLRPENSITKEIAQEDFNRLQMAEVFRISKINEDFKVCATYPEHVIVPKDFSDDDIIQSAPYRGLNRFPAVVWRSVTNKAVLLRSAQPQVGILSWRNAHDEKLFENISNVVKSEGAESKQLIIMDCRTYAAAFANRARSGGFENTEYYQQSKLEFLGLPNIHTVRNSFIAMRNLLHNASHNEQLLSNLQNTGWLLNLSNLLSSASNCADYLSKGHSVLVHCSDGWDRTTQIVSLAKLMLDDYYRTIPGFEELIRREWLDFGHKFYDRQQSFNGNWDAGERSPIFLQFLEAVRHLQREQPTAFHFTHAYLIKLAQHAYSGLFGTFLFNSQKEKRAAIESRNLTLVEIWRFLGTHNQEFVNQSVDDKYKGQLKTMNFSVLNLRVWHEVFADDEERYTNLYAPSANQNPTQNVVLTPSRESTNNGIVERSSSGCGTPMTSSANTLVKSKSSESVHSVNTDGNTSINSMQHGVHSGSNGTISSIEAVAAGTSSPPQSMNMESVVSPHVPASMSTSVNRVRKTVQETLDYDGLVKYQDDEQEVYRRYKENCNTTILLQQKKINELENRQRSVSERAAHSNGSGYMNGHIGSPLNSLSELESSLGRAESDMSIINTEVDLPNLKPLTGWEANMKPCYLCNREFKKISVHSEERKHHCRNCGRVVCDSCSQQRYHDIEEERGVMKRVCDVCYENMQQKSNQKKTSNDGVLSRTSSLGEMSIANDPFCDSPCSSPSSVSLNMLPTQPQTIHSSSCKSSSNSIGSPRPSPGEFSRHGSSQAVKG